MAYRVKCVNKDDSSDYDDCRCITTIGIPRKGGGTNEYTPAKIYDRIENDGDEFYVEYQGSKTDLVAVEGENGNYVRTEPTDTTDDNLLKQPSC